MSMRRGKQEKAFEKSSFQKTNAAIKRRPLKTFCPSDSTS